MEKVRKVTSATDAQRDSSGTLKNGNAALVRTKSLIVQNVRMMAKK